MLAPVQPSTPNAPPKNDAGHIRWLRPDFQNPNALDAPKPNPTSTSPPPPPPPRPARKSVGPPPSPIRSASSKILRATPVKTPQQIAAGFRPARRTRVEEILKPSPPSSRSANSPSFVL